MTFWVSRRPFDSSPNQWGAFSDELHSHVQKENNFSSGDTDFHKYKQHQHLERLDFHGRKATLKRFEFNLITQQYEL